MTKVINNKYEHSTTVNRGINKLCFVLEKIDNCLVIEENGRDYETLKQIILSEEEAIILRDHLNRVF